MKLGPDQRTTLTFSNALSVSYSADRGLLKVHNILGESSSLVAEDIFDLAKIVGDVPSLGKTWLIELEGHEEGQQ